MTSWDEMAAELENRMEEDLISLPEVHLNNQIGAMDDLKTRIEKASLDQGSQ